MSGKFRDRSAATRCRVASPLDLLRALERSERVGKLKAAAPVSAAGRSLQKQAPLFLREFGI
jgi:hypothetical protein